jgi:ribosomal protein S1
MTMMEEEISFPRGGGVGDGPRRKPTSKQDANDEGASKKKRKTTDDSPASVKSDLLFGTKSKKNDGISPSSSSSKRRKKGEDVSTDSNNKLSLLPLGGGGVVISTRRVHSKKGSNETTSTTTTAGTPIIEALSFSKLAKGTKVLAHVKQVQDEFALVSLPNLLTAYILPQAPYPLRHTLAVGQTLAVVVQKVAAEQVAGGASRRRIQVTPLPQAINSRSLLMGDDNNNKKFTLASAANRLSRSSIPVRGQILSIEDHGCVVDLGFGARGFVQFEHIHEGNQNYTILEDGDEEEEEEAQDTEDGDGGKRSTSIVLQKGRLYDFWVLPVSNSSANEQSATVVPLSLPSTTKFADQSVSDLSTTSSSSRHHKNSTVATTPLSLSSLTPGWLVQVKVEALAANGLCVSFFGNVFRGAMEMNHLGATFVPTSKDGSSVDGGWKNLAASLFHKHQHFLARILAVDVPAKLVRLSIAPHVLNLGRVTDVTSTLSGFPDVGSVVPDCTVVKLDPGIGALLALPSQYNYSDDQEALVSKTLAKSCELFSNPTFQEACRVRKVYVHISKALDEAEEGEGRNLAFAGRFQKEFAPSTKHSVRILTTGHWIEGVAAGACAPSILEAHVLSHDDLVVGKVYKQVPVCAHMPGGSVLVQLGGSTLSRKKNKKETINRGVSGLIPPLQLFETTSTGSSEYRKRVVKTKYALDAKVDVRVLWVDPVRKKCLVTAKKSIVHAPSDQIIISYNDLKVGQVGVGFISRIDDDCLYVTFCNKVYGRVTARSLATELGVEDHKGNFTVGDVVTCRVVALKRVYSKGRHAPVSRDAEMDENGDDDEDRPTSHKSASREYWELTVSLKAAAMDGGDAVLGMDDIDIEHPEPIRLRPGAILPKKAMKIVKLVDGRRKKSGAYTPGYAVVLLKSKYVIDDNHTGQGKMTETIECKLPYSQLLDVYDPADIHSSDSLNQMAMLLLKVGKKINQKGIVLVDPNKSNVEYSSGIGRMPIVSLRKKLISTKEQQDDVTKVHSDDAPFVPSPSSDLFVGASVLGFVTQIDPRHGGFVRFLDGLTGLITKKQGGLRLPLFSTVVTRVKAIDDSLKPHRILLEWDSNRQLSPSRDVDGSSIEVGDILGKAIVSEISFNKATLSVVDWNSKKETFLLHCTNKDSAASVVKRQKKPMSHDDSRQITKIHPFYGIKTGHEFERLTVVGMKRHKNRVDVFVTDKDVNSQEVPRQGGAPSFVETASQLEPGMRAKTIVVGYAMDNKGLIVQVGPSVRGFVPGLELSRDIDVLNDLSAHVSPGAVLDCLVLDREQWYKNCMSCPLPFYYKNRLKKGLEREQIDHRSVYLSVLACDSEDNVVSRPSEGDVAIGRINRSLPQIQAPSLMLELRGGFVGRCCITELDEPDEWANMPLGISMIASGTNHLEKDNSQGKDVRGVDEQDEEQRNSG